jgi:hypothetical protein
MCVQLLIEVCRYSFEDAPEDLLILRRNIQLAAIQDLTYKWKPFAGVACDITKSFRASHNDTSRKFALRIDDV